MSSRAREYVPRRSTIDLSNSPLQSYETTMSRAWEFWRSSKSSSASSGPGTNNFNYARVAAGEWHERRVRALGSAMSCSHWTASCVPRNLLSTSPEAFVAIVFPPNSLWAMSRLPGEDAWGLFAPLPHRRVNSLNALRDILRSWVRYPPKIKDAKPLQLSDSQEHIEELEGWIALFYTQTSSTCQGEHRLYPIVGQASFGPKP